jgi:hypothetical protein
VCLTLGGLELWLGLNKLEEVNARMGARNPS